MPKQLMPGCRNRLVTWPANLGTLCSVPRLLPWPWPGEPALCISPGVERDGATAGAVGGLSCEIEVRGGELSVASCSEPKSLPDR